jgi:NitT/TauT family transport system permease protein
LAWRAVLTGAGPRMQAFAARWSGSAQAFASLLLLVLAWQAAASLAQDPLLPTPGRVLARLAAEARDGELFRHLGITMARVAVSFALAFALGSGLGLALGRLPIVDHWLRPWMIVLLNIPALVAIILAYVWLGLTETALLAAVAANKVPNVAMTVREGARALERDYAELASVYRFSAWVRLRHVVLPQLSPYLLAAARNGLALIWKIVLVVELLGRSDGVGFQLQMLFQMFDVAGIIAYSVAFVACMLAVEALILAPIERRADDWRR